MEVKFCFKWNSHLGWLLAGIIAASNFYTETGTVDTKLWEKSILNTLRDLKTAEKKKEYKSVSVYAYSKCIDLLKSSFLELEKLKVPENLVGFLDYAKNSYTTFIEQPVFKGQQGRKRKNVFALSPKQYQITTPRPGVYSAFTSAE